MRDVVFLIRTFFHNSRQETDVLHIGFRGTRDDLVHDYSQVASNFQNLLNPHEHVKGSQQSKENF